MEDRFYAPLFASIYDEHFPFAGGLAEPVAALHESVAGPGRRMTVLDVGCGTGTLAIALLAKGYDVVGVDSSPSMLDVAREKAAAAGGGERLRFVEGDFRTFSLGERFGIATCTFDALNHLPTADDLEATFRRVHEHLLPGAPFVFDLHTDLGLREHNFVSVNDYDDVFLLRRTVYNDAAHQATARVTGFVNKGDAWHRVVQEAVVTAWPCDEVSARLRASGFSRSWTARLDSLTEPLADPEAQRRVFVVAVRDG